MQAHGGTLFLDELCEMELEMQKKLLRFLQTGTFTPLGGNREIKVDVRIICATNRDPLVEVEEGRFREDLYYRVHVVPIEMPPLRERGSDITTLANHFLKLYAKQDKKKFRSIDKETQTLLKRYPWPGNVRQLQNVIRNIVVLNNETSVTKDMVPPPINKADITTPKSVTPIRSVAPVTAPQPVAIPEAKLPPLTPEELEYTSTTYNNQQMPEQAPMTPPLTTSDGAIRPMWQIEREAIQHAINHCDGNVLNAAVLLELSPSTVYRKKQAWESEDEYNQA
jgi:DNA-binding NtrC family response regulator